MTERVWLASIIVNTGRGWSEQGQYGYNEKRGGYIAKSPAELIRWGREQVGKEFVKTGVWPYEDQFAGSPVVAVSVEEYIYDEDRHDRYDEMECFYMVEAGSDQIRFVDERRLADFRGFH